MNAMLRERDKKKIENFHGPNKINIYLLNQIKEKSLL